MAMLRLVRLLELASHEVEWAVPAKMLTVVPARVPSR